MKTEVPERVGWAVELLALEPGDRVLEIGGGSSVAAAPICDRLVHGRMVGIDRSPIQVERARRRHAAHLAAGRLSLETVELADFDSGPARFDKVLAINVNLFWLGPATAELAAIRRAATPGGELYLVYGTPTPKRARDATERLHAVLGAQGFEQVEAHAPTPTLIGLVFQPRSSPR